MKLIIHTKDNDLLNEHCGKQPNAENIALFLCTGNPRQEMENVEQIAMSDRYPCLVTNSEAVVLRLLRLVREEKIPVFDCEIDGLELIVTQDGDFETYSDGNPVLAGWWDWRAEELF